ncbi:chaperone protein dnaJ 72 isoform X2 [Elaeis guineensis]|uniref:Chaperone protein dnaJ 72 isoform X2 n=1 Tax=Elaeis guineensis var. tenera TaxID=51953 RepID=A0A6I9QE22_ELAGV|nr:chaperone protein dnaJ 72 isoform X2 [Elaeis guineensis]
MDYYKTLGLSRNATKEEIKEAFRRSALKFHPDRHAQSSKEVRDGASLQFKQASEAYEVLIDDRKRADYDRGRRGASFERWSCGQASSSSYYYGGRQYGYGGGGGGYRRPPPGDGGLGFDVESVFRFLTRRGFLVNIAFASAILGGAVVIERSAGALWKFSNSGAKLLWTDLAGSCHITLI